MGRSRSLATLGTASTVAGQIPVSTGSGFTSGTVSETRQTVISGPTDVNGFPNFLTFANTTATLQNVTSTTPLVVYAAAGFNQYGRVDRIGFINTNSLTWSGLSTNGQMYLYVDVAANGTMTTGSTTLLPIYQFSTTPSTTNLQNTFSITSMIMYVGNGSVATQVYRVFVGEVTVAGGVVTVVTPYAYDGKYVSLPQTGLTGTTLVSVNHNIGVMPLHSDVWVEFTSATNGWAIGDRIRLSEGLASSGGVRDASLGPIPSRMSVGVVLTGNVELTSKTGAYIPVSALSHSVVFFARRGW